MHEYISMDSIILLLVRLDIGEFSMNICCYIFSSYSFCILPMNDSVFLDTLQEMERYSNLNSNDDEVHNLVFFNALS